MADDKYLTIRAMLETGQFDQAAEAMGKRLQAMADGTKKYESAAQTVNRRLREHERALNASTDAMKNKISFTQKLENAMTKVGLKFALAAVGLRSLEMIMGKARAAYGEMINNTAVLRERSDQLNASLKGLSMSMGQAFAPALTKVYDLLISTAYAFSTVEARAKNFNTVNQDKLINDLKVIEALKQQIAATKELNATNNVFTPGQMAARNTATEDLARLTNELSTAQRQYNDDLANFIKQEKQRKDIQKQISDATKEEKDNAKKGAIIQIDQKQIKGQVQARRGVIREMEVIDVAANNAEKKRNEDLAKAKQESTLEAAGATAAGIADIWANSAKDDRKRAERMRVVALGEAIINTAVNVSKLLWNPPAAALAAAMGALQVGKIASQKFAQGTRFAPGGMAMVGENGPEMINVPRGSRVFTAAETKNIMDVGGINININGNATPETVQGLRMAAKDITRALEQAARNGFLNKSRLGFA